MSTFATKSITEMKKGLVLEGGGLRGMFTEGVIDAMMANGITFDGMIGVSAGVLFGCNLKSHQIGRALRYNIKLKNDPYYISLRSLIKTGNIVNTEVGYRKVPFEIDIFDKETFEKDPMHMWMVCTDIEKGKPVYHEMKKVSIEEMEWMRASASMPAVSHPVEIDGHVMLDGGIIDSIPLKAFQEMGYERNIVVLTQPSSYKKKPTKIAWLIGLFTRKYPKVAEMMAHRHKMYNAELDYIAAQAKSGNTLLIYPDKPLGIGRTELNERKMRRVYAQGYKKAQAMMNEIKTFLNQQ